MSFFKNFVTLNTAAFQQTLQDEAGVPVGAIQPVVDEVLAQIKAIQLPKTASDFKTFVASVLGLKSGVQKIVVLVESLSATVKQMSGEQKKNLAVDLLDSLFEFPLVIEQLDHFIFSTLVTFVVDELNKRFGNQWTEANIKSVVAGN